MVIASKLGVGVDTDSFYFAFAAIIFVFGGFGGSCSAALIPIMVHQIAENRNRDVLMLIEELLLLAILLLVLVAVLSPIFYYFLVLYISPEYTRDQTLRTVSLFCTLLPFLLFRTLTQILHSALNANKRFFLPSSSLMLPPLGATLFTFLLAGDLGPYAPAIGLAAGSCAEFLVSYMGVSVTLKSVPLPHYHGCRTTTRAFISEYLPMLAGSFLMGSTLFVTNGMAAAMGTGAISLLNYGTRPVSLLNTFVGNVLATTLLPFYSRLLATKGGDTLRRTAWTSSFYVLLLSTPVSIILILSASYIIGLLYPTSGSLLINADQLTAILKFAAFQIPAHCIGVVSARVLSSGRMNKVLFRGAVLGLFAQILLNYLLGKWLGAPGLALSTTFVWYLTFFYKSSNFRNIERRD